MIYLHPMNISINIQIVEKVMQGQEPVKFPIQYQDIFFRKEFGMLHASISVEKLRKFFY